MKPRMAEVGLGPTRTGRNEYLAATAHVMRGILVTLGEVIWGSILPQALRDCHAHSELRVLASLIWS